jgi:hypothetical protein
LHFLTVGASYQYLKEQRTQDWGHYCFYIALVIVSFYVFRFAGQTLSSKSLVLVTIKTLENEKANVSVNCEKMVIGSMLLNEIKSFLRN